MNTFDFYAIRVSSTRKADLLNAGVRPENIRTTTRWELYGRRNYPRRTYTGSLTFIEATDPNARAKVDEAIAKAKAKGLNAHAEYHARD